MTALQGFVLKDGHGTLHVLCVCSALRLQRAEVYMSSQTEEAHAELSRAEGAAGLAA